MRVNPFVQADSSITRQFGGTGLGLAISMRIAEMLDGTITINSEVGKGSVFTIEIGMQVQQLDEAIENLPQESGACTVWSAGISKDSVINGRTILVVDDVPTNRKLVRLILSRLGANVETAEHGQEAVQRLGEKHFDLVLMDLQMPIMDGYTAIARIREQGLKVPVIALTAHAMKEDEQRCRQAGCTGYLAKPIVTDQLIHTVISAFEGGPKATGMRPLPGAPKPADGVIALKSTLPVDDPEFNEIVQEFVEHLKEKLVEMRDAYASNDVESLTGLTHWLKGAGGTAGFAQLSELGERLEILVQQSELDQLALGIREMADMVGRIEIPPSLPESMAESLERVSFLLVKDGNSHGQI